jgi:hypothetical protein
MGRRPVRDGMHDGDDMPLNEEIHRLIHAWERTCLGFTEFENHMWGQLCKLPLPEKRAVLATLSAHANEDVQKAAFELETMVRQEELSKNLDYVRENSPLHRGVRLELFGGYDYGSSGGKPWWLNGRDCYTATFLAFVSYGENTIPAGLVEFDEVVEVPGHRGRYGVLLASFGSDSVAWEQSNGLVVVYISETLPEDLSFLRCSHTSATAIETHATYRVSEIA